MSIEELLDLSACELREMSDEQLREYFAPYLEFIRPIEKKKDEEKEGMKIKKSSGSNAYREAEKGMELAQRLAKQLGIKI